MKQTVRQQHAMGSIPECRKGQVMTIPNNRHAATLTEILMSLMVMSIGLVSVASLFPITMLRSIQATQMTNASLLNYQCEDYSQAFPSLLEGNFDSGSGLNIPNIEFADLSYSWGRNVTDVDGDGDRDRADLQALLPLNYAVVIDPVGYYFNLQSGTPASATRYGSDDFQFYGNNANRHGRYAIDRKNAGFNLGNTTQRDMAFSMFASRDSWSDLLTADEVAVVSATQLTLSDADPGDLQTYVDSVAAGSIGRAVVTNQTGRQSIVTGAAVNVATQQVTLGTSMPGNGFFNSVPEVRLQLLETRYTCLITLRRQLLSFGPDGLPGTSGVDDNGDTVIDNLRDVGWPGTDDVIRSRGANLVVFFRRDYSTRSEQVYPVEGMFRSAAGVSAPIRIFWDSTDEDAKPNLKQGNYMFDPVNGYWYQIRSILVDDADVATGLAGTAEWVPGTCDRFTELELDRTIEANAQFVMVPDNVVEVFDFPAY